MIIHSAHQRAEIIIEELPEQNLDIYYYDDDINTLKCKINSSENDALTCFYDMK